MPHLQRTKMELFQVDAHCDKCGAAMAFVGEVEEQTGLYLTTKTNLHRCPACGAEAGLDRVYPHQYVAPAESAPTVDQVGG